MSEKFQTRKSLGQNFIHDIGFLDSVVGRLGLGPADVVVEIGAGLGTLTACLAKRVGRVIAFEIDARLEPILSEKFASPSNVKLVFGDIMDFSEAQINGLVGPFPFKLVANIPYYITTPILLKFLRLAECREICVLVQAEVAERIVAAVGGKDYGALSVTCQIAADCRIARAVPRSFFRPIPNVDSAFVILKKRVGGLPPPGPCVEGVTTRSTAGAAEEPSGYGDERSAAERGRLTPSTPPAVGFDNFIKAVFSKRRKKISNSVDRAVLTRLGIDENLRPENISPAQFVKIYEETRK